MIAGPLVPRRPPSLPELVTGDPGVVESGLAIVAEDLELDTGIALDALARDAIGRPVAILFAASRAGEDDDRGRSGAAALAGRVLQVHGWLSLHRHWFVARFWNEPAATARLAPRVMVLGFGCAPAALPLLEGLRLPELQVLELHSWAIGGERQWSAVPVLGPREEPAVPSLPSGLLDAALRTSLAPLFAWLARLEPEVVVHGDRYSRLVRLGGRPLLELRVCGRGAWLAIGAGPLGRVDPAEPWPELADRVLREHLRAAVGPAFGALAGPAVREGAGAAPAAAPAAVSPHASLRRAPLDHLRAVADTCLSREEFDALEEASPNGG